ncbi:hypothetical protein D0Z03_002070 [Geotrichum reessii]|nr:hypothetical protein D0Z03_002070 [Galactomyces reessii]
MSSVALNNSNPFDNSTVSGGNDDMISFFSEVDEIKRSLVHYETNIERIEALHKRSLAEVADGSEGFTSNQLASLTEETSALARDLRNRIKSLESRSQRDSTKRTQADNVKHQFKNSIKRYQGIEANFRQKNKERIERQYRIDEEVQEAVNSENQQIFSQAVMNSNRLGQAQSALNEVEARHKEIQNISRTMNELAELFHDMEMMVAEQEPVLQEIEAKAEEAQGDIEAGVGMESKAIASARAARKKKWWCLLIIVIVLAIIAIVLGVTLSKK